MDNNILDIFVRKTSVLLNMPEEWVDAITSHQWKETHNKLNECTSVEVSGLAKYKVRQNVAKRKIDKLVAIIAHNVKLLETERDDKKIKAIDALMQRCKESIEYLQTKLKDEA